MNDNIYLSRSFIRAFIIAVIVIFSVLLLASFLGFNSSPETADQIATEVENLAATTTWTDIFLNNFGLTLVTFVPFFGIFFALYVQFNTGYILGALAQAYNIGNVQATLSILASPIGLLEYSAYTLALAESINIVFLAYKKELKKRLFNHTWKTLIIVALLLLIGAVVEASLLRRL